MKKIGLIVAAADGIVSLQTGVGIVVNSFFEGVDEIVSRLELDYEPDLYAVAPQIRSDSSDFDDNVSKLVQEACLRYNGRQIFLSKNISGTSLNEVWKGTNIHSPAEIWEGLCKEFAIILLSLSELYDQLYVITHDTLFANLSRFVESNTVRICWIPHSLSTLFPVINQDERFEFERGSIVSILKRCDKIGFISHDTKKHLINLYGVPEVNIVSFYSGIYFNSKRYLNKNRLEHFYLSNNIPRDKEIAFTWARCSEQKGIDIIIDAFIKLHKEYPKIAKRYHLLLFCPTETSYSDYLIRILESISQLPVGSYTFIKKFEDSVPFEILSSKRTKIVMLCSRFESFGLTSIEALYFSSSNSTIFYTAIPTFKEVLYGQRNTIMLEVPNSTNLLSSLLLFYNNYTKPVDNRNDANLSRYSLVENVVSGINELLD